MATMNYALAEIHPDAATEVSTAIQDIAPASGNGAEVVDIHSRAQMEQATAILAMRLVDFKLNEELIPLQFADDALPARFLDRYALVAAATGTQETNHTAGNSGAELSPPSGGSKLVMRAVLVEKYNPRAEKPSALKTRFRQTIGALATLLASVSSVAGPSNSPGETALQPMVIAAPASTQLGLNALEAANNPFHGGDESAQAMSVVPDAASKVDFGVFKIKNNLYSETISGSSEDKYAIQYYGNAGQEPFQTKDVERAEAEGITPVIELQIPPSDLVPGKDSKYIKYLKAFAADAAATKKPIDAIVDHEMNSPTYAWGDSKIKPARYRQIWRIITSTMAPIAKNIKWVWAPDTEKYDGASIDQYYPGTDVDIIAEDAYLGSRDSSAANTIDPTIKAEEKLAKEHHIKGPIWLTETGVNQADPNRIQQIGEIVTAMRRYGRGVFLYFDARGKADWELNSKELAALKADVK